MSDSTLPDEYDADSVETLIEETQRPYTPKQRTQLVTDILNHRQELKQGTNEDFDDKMWQRFHEEITNGSDKLLDEEWDQVGIWILSRNDIPLAENNPVAQMIEEHIEDCDTDIEPTNAVLIEQQYKRFSDNLSADYGFLGRRTYTHTTGGETEDT